MIVNKKIYPKNRKQWRAWLKKNHQKEKEIWLLFYNKSSGKPTLSYSDAVEEALCFGWIDSTVKKAGGDSHFQRFTPRKKGSPFSEMNKERVRRLIKKRLMTKAGLIAAGNISAEFTYPKDIMDAIRSDKETYTNFMNFPEHYRRIRIAFIDGARKRPEEFKKRLNYFIRMTKKNKKFGMIQ